MTLAQKWMVDHLLAGEHGGTNEPFNVTLRDSEMGEAAFKAVVEKFGERGAVDCFVSMTLNIDPYPLPDGAKPKLQPVP